MAAADEAARALADRLLRLDDAALSALRGVGGAGILLVLGAPERLPWADGVTYLGRDPRAPSLLLPTCHEPCVAPDILERALLADLADPALPVAVLLHPPRLVPAGGVRPVERGVLRSWRDGGS